MSDWILVVDDDALNLKMASKIMSAANMRVSCLKSGEAAIDFLKENHPDLILLDVHMPGMDGFQTIAAIRENEATADIPVIFLTADYDGETERKGLESGAMDFIKKPFVSEVLLLRVRHTIDLVRLQTDLSSEVEKMTCKVRQKNEKLKKLSSQIVIALFNAIEAKDSYTNGHSARVALYAREIGKRIGFSADEQNDIYMIGLLHDVGKIGIPDMIINKTISLSDEEYTVISQHPQKGAAILSNIAELPGLVIGARWHHERFDGKGYPDGLSGEDIPIEARIIAIADAYDAMSSKRSYRDVMPQQQVHVEIEKGMGTQFDPKLARVMLDMIDEDTAYTMREN